MQRLLALPLCFLLLHAPTLGAQPTFESAVAVEFGCQFHATDSFARLDRDDGPDDATSYLDLMSEAAQLETQLVQLDSSNELWSQEQTEILIELARAKQLIGDTSQARDLYEQALYNIRINDGVYSIRQLPILLDLMTWYMAADDEFIDQLGDRAAFIYEKAYSDDSQVMELVAGYQKLIRLRANAHFSQDRRRSIHVSKVVRLQDKIESQLERLANLIGNNQSARAIREPTFYTRYDDLGQALPEPEGGMDQVSSATGLILEEVQSLLRPTTSESDVDYDRAKDLLDELHDGFDDLGPIDRTAVLDFYADYYLAQDNIAAAIDAYERILKVRVLRPDYQLRALRALGQLYENEQRWHDAIDSYNCWRQLSTREDARVFIGLANAYRKEQEIELAIYHLNRHIETLENDDQLAEQDLYLVLKDMYYEIDDFESAARVTRTIVSKFE